MKNVKTQLFHTIIEGCVMWIIKSMLARSPHWFVSVLPQKAASTAADAVINSDHVYILFWNSFLVWAESES